MVSPPLRRLLEDRVSQLLADAEAAAGETLDRAVRECADRLNQSVRRLRQAEDVSGLGATLVDASSAFATGVALFRIADGSARLDGIRGMEAEEIPARFEIPLASAPAFAGAIETRDPVTAAAVPGEISSDVAGLLGHAADVRVVLVPIVTGDTVPAVLYTWGKVEQSALELLAQVTAGAWARLAAPPAEPASAAPLVTIAPAAEPAAARDSASWDALPHEDQQIHLRAQRFARVQVAEMRLFEAEAVQSGRARRDLYGTLAKSIGAARQQFQERFFARCPSMVDYLHLELVRTLAHDDAELLGTDYPGPLV